MPYRSGFPLPDTKDWNAREWWQHVKDHKLVVQRCTQCGAYRHSPVPICSQCRSFDYAWAPVSGKGTVYSYTIAHHPPSPAMAHLVPYNVVVVELEDADQVRMVGNLIDVPDGEVEVGMPVEVVFDDVNDEVTLPQWRLRRS